MDRLDAYLIDALRDFDPDRIVIFGSRAGGSARADSDVDVLIVKDDPRRWVERVMDATERLYSERLVEARRDLPPFDVLVYTPAEIAERLALGDPFFAEMVSGRLVYERPRRAA